MDRYALRSVNSKIDLIAADSGDHDLNVIADHNYFVYFARQCKHYLSLVGEGYILLKKSEAP